MATTVATATMTVTIQEELFLNSKDQGSKTTRSITGIGEYQRSIKRCIEDKTTTLVLFDQTSADVLAVNEWFDQKVKYIRVTNLDSAVTAELIIDCTGGDIIFKLLPEESFLMIGGEDPMSFTAGTGASATTFVNANFIKCHVTTGDCDLEVVVASTPAT